VEAFMFKSKKERILFVVLAIVGILLTLNINNAFAGCNWNYEIDGNSIVYKVQGRTGWRLVTIVRTWEDYNINRDSVRGIVFRDETVSNCGGSSQGRCHKRIVLDLPSKSGTEYALVMYVTCGYGQAQRNIVKITW